MTTTNRIVFTLLVLFVSVKSFSQQSIAVKVNLSGNWQFRIDSLDRGEQEQWYNKTFSETVVLPGSMTSNQKGNEISVHTKWTGSIVDSSWFFKTQYERFRQPGNIKVPFWLQPIKYYTGAAWYQKKITIPATWKEKEMFLSIERSHWETTVWIDGKKVGTQNSLSTQQVFYLGTLKAGEHQLSIRVDNRVKQVDVGQNSHSISDHTQTNWNGMIGEIALTAKPKLYIGDVALYPDIKNKIVTAKILVRNNSGKKVTASLQLLAVSSNKSAEKLNQLYRKVTVDTDSSFIEINYPMGSNPLLWDEFHPDIYSMKLVLQSDVGADEKQVQFGMREFKARGTQFEVNNRPIFLRGTLECAIFPLTGFPPTDTSSWMRIFRIAKSFGLNNFRFHSWCPPEAAFDAADRSGIYLQIECASWANQGSSLGDGKPIDQFIYDESKRIVTAYGNHPSFCMMAYGNEPAGKNQVAYLTGFVNYWKKNDARRVYTSGAGWPVIAANEYNNFADPRIQQWGGGLTSVINGKNPSTNYDWTKIIAAYTVPVVSHEIGQWCVYPDFKEISKYKGVLKARNFEIFQTVLRENGLGNYADSFLLASGKLQTLCYKSDIEAALRTKGMGGFHLLDLHDFPGQGTALVGVLNPFWEEKGYVTAKEYSAFCNSTVPLVRFPKMIYLNNEELILPVEVAHFGPKELRNVTPVWEIKDVTGKILFKGSLPQTDIKIGNGNQAGKIVQSLSTIKEASKLILSVSIENYQNTWDFFVYPATLPKTPADILIAQSFDDAVLDKLKNGGKVLITLPKGSIRKEAGGTIAIGFSSIFWNTAWTGGQPPHTLGILVNPKHPAFNQFPTDYYSNWQWWDAMSHSNAILLDSVSKGIKPVVRVIDDWVTARSLGLVIECKVGNGKLLLTSIDLISENEKRPEAKQLLYSLLNYMEGKLFNPADKVEWERLKKLVNTEPH